jgi:hypothetical protein
MDNRLNASGRALERVNLILTRDNSSWLDGLSNEIRVTTGAEVSRSEIVRAAVSTLAELHRLAPVSTKRIIPLGACKTEGELAVAGILAIRLATAR